MAKENIPLKILLVEDDAISAYKVVFELKNEGHLVTHCPNGLEAFAFLENNAIDVIVSDVNMPTIDGFALLQLVRNSEKLASTIFIIVSSLIDSNFIRKGMLLGADDYLCKPLVTLDLLNAISARVKRHSNLHFNLLSKETDEIIKKQAVASIPDILSKREGEVFSFLSKGMSNKEIADLLLVSPKTVMNHRQSIMDKLGLTGNGSLYKYAKNSLE